ncbi:MAG: MarR family winged helix-turn-helix transcriptional regulator [Candidatus Saccharimonadales bacterium]|jgi:DNA-binding MarR family transcriptional regulator
MKNNLPTIKSKFPPLLHFTYNLQHLAEELLLAKAGVGLSQARIMSGLSSSVARSQRHLAAELNQTEANISRQLKEMKRHGLVSITKNKKDGRQRDVILTTKGNHTYQKAEKALRSQQSKFLRALNKGEADALEFAAQKLSHH